MGTAGKHPDSVLMYLVSDFGNMIADSRTDIYAIALKKAVSPESAVLDIGSGAGILSFLACQCQARKVYAVEPSDAIIVASQIARANGFADRIEFIQGLSTRTDLVEKVDVIVSDIHGVLTPFQNQIPSIIDARQRLLAPNGVIIPQRESLWAAVVEAPETYGSITSPWKKNRFGLSMDAACRIVTNTWRKVSIAPDQLLTEPSCWAKIDYATVESPDFDQTITLEVLRPGTAHGLVLWFDAELTDGVGFSNAPGQPKMIYGSGFFPWTDPVALTPGDSVQIRLQATLTGDDYVWSWESRVTANGEQRPKAHFRQSTFWGSPLSLQRLQKREAGHRPALSETAKIDRMILDSIDGTVSNGDIAKLISKNFPASFCSASEALTRVADLTERYSETR